MRQTKTLIRAATSGDLAEIHAWLIAEDRRGTPGNFLCNWGWIERLYGEGKVSVCVDSRRGHILGYLAGDFVGSSILQVRFEHRGRGVGSALVDHRIAQHLEANETLLKVHCAPQTSIGFWRTMGFDVAARGWSNPTGHRVLPLRFELPPGRDVAVKVRFFAHSPRSPVCQAPLATFSPEARVDREGVIVFAERVQVHDEGPRRVTTSASSSRSTADGGSWGRSVRRADTSPPLASSQLRSPTVGSRLYGATPSIVCTSLDLRNAGDHYRCWSTPRSLRKLA